MAKRKPLIWGEDEANYFCAQDWTTQIKLNRLEKFDFACMGFFGRWADRTKRHSSEFACRANRMRHDRTDDEPRSRRSIGSRKPTWRSWPAESAWGYKRPSPRELPSRPEMDIDHLDHYYEDCVSGGRIPWRRSPAPSRRSASLSFHRPRDIDGKYQLNIDSRSVVVLFSRLTLCESGSR